MDVTPEEFVERLMNDEGSEKPADDCQSSEIDIHLPPWYDAEKFKIGQRFYFENLYGQIGAHVLGLITIISVPTILKVLVYTRRSNSAYTAYRRYANTLLHIVAWHSYDLKPGSTAWKSILDVRKRHLRAGKTARRSGVGSVTQRDLVLTQFAFVAHSLLYPDRFGMGSCSNKSWDGFVHMWKTFTYMMGVEDKYNICVGTVEETTEVCRVLMRRVYAPLLEFPPEPYEHMAYAVTVGIWSIMPLVDPRSTMYAVKVFAGVPGFVYTKEEIAEFNRKITNGEIETNIKPVKEGWHEPQPRPLYNPEEFRHLSTIAEYNKLNFLEKLKLFIAMFLMSLNRTYVGKIFLNNVLYFLLFLTSTFPILAFIRWGVSGSWVNMFEESIADRAIPMSNAAVRSLLNKPTWYQKFNILKKYR